ncbi:TetR/AcrR family transcriptional regulator [Sulfitobacter sp. JB4-11]|uniref:TetR/AcrR family transcriptional regulator n=1 Tax=Sulfitobacter rhodophyticola TaxID=3238304 RepID=UPI003514A82A
MVDKTNPRGRGRPRKFDADVVLDEVINAFWELGYEAADTETLAKRTGLTKPSLYNAFGSKEDLFVAAINRYRQTRSKSSFDALMQADTPQEGIRDYFLNLAENVAGEGHPSGCLIMSVALPTRDRLQKVAAIFDKMPKESHARLTEYFDGQIGLGNLPQGFKSADAIALFQDLGAAMIMQARAGAPLEVLKNKAIRNTQLVMFEGGARSESDISSR